MTCGNWNVRQAVSQQVFIETTHTHTHPFNGPLSGTTRVSQYQKGKTNLDFSEARDSEWQWHRLNHMQVCTSLQTDNHANTSLLIETTFCINTCFQSFSILISRIVHHAVLKFSPCRKKPLPQASTCPHQYTCS